MSADSIATIAAAIRKEFPFTEAVEHFVRSNGLRYQLDIANGDARLKPAAIDDAVLFLIQHDPSKCREKLASTIVATYGGYFAHLRDAKDVSISFYEGINSGERSIRPWITLLCGAHSEKVEIQKCFTSVSDQKCDSLLNSDTKAGIWLLAPESPLFSPSLSYDLIKFALFSEALRLFERSDEDRLRTIESAKRLIRLDRRARNDFCRPLKDKEAEVIGAIRRYCNLVEPNVSVTRHIIADAKSSTYLYQSVICLSGAKDACYIIGASLNTIESGEGESPQYQYFSCAAQIASHAFDQSIFTDDCLVSNISEVGRSEMIKFLLAEAGYRRPTRKSESYFSDLKRAFPMAEITSIEDSFEVRLGIRRHLRRYEGRPLRLSEESILDIDRDLQKILSACNKKGVLIGGRVYFTADGETPGGDSYSVPIWQISKNGSSVEREGVSIGSASWHFNIEFKLSVSFPHRASSLVLVNFMIESLAQKNWML